WMGGERADEVFRRIERGGGRVELAHGPPDRRLDQIWLRFGPGNALRHLCELIGQRPIASWADDLADRQVVYDHSGGELPVARLGGVPHRVGELAVPLVPAGSRPVQRADPVRAL